MPDNELPREKPLEARLKYGKRNVILAVVDMGVVSHLRFSEAGFGTGSCLKTRIRNVTGKRDGEGVEVAAVVGERMVLEASSFCCTGRAKVQQCLCTI